MGGVLIIVSIVIPTLLWADLRNSYVWIAVFTLLAYGAIGFVDDYAKIAKHRNLGLTARRKMLYQVGAGFRGGGRADVHAHFRRLFHGHERSVPEELQAHAADLVAAGEQLDLCAGRAAVLHLRGGGDRGLVEWREPHRWSGWPGDRPDGGRLGRADRADLRRRPRHAGRVSADRRTRAPRS
jgi:hypothetical protein